jgi:hypothetical protein
MLPEERNLYELARAVGSEADFLQFAQALLADWQDEVEQMKLRPLQTGASGPNGWENRTIEMFLEAMIAWSKDRHHERPFNDPPSWGLFAVMLLMGSRYE